MYYLGLSLLISTVVLNFQVELKGAREWKSRSWRVLLTWRWNNNFKVIQTRSFSKPLCWALEETLRKSRSSYLARIVRFKNVLCVLHQTLYPKPRFPNSNLTLTSPPRLLHNHPSHLRQRVSHDIHLPKNLQTRFLFQNRTPSALKPITFPISTNTPPSSKEQHLPRFPSRTNIPHMRSSEPKLSILPFLPQHFQNRSIGLLVRFPNTLHIATQ